MKECVPFLVNCITTAEARHEPRLTGTQHAQYLTDAYRNTGERAVVPKGKPKNINTGILSVKDFVIPEKAIPY
jgi:hypothetical protein